VVSQVPSGATAIATTRHGRYFLRGDEVLAARDFADAIARCGAPVEVHGGGERMVWR
jgi:hypothetical protein